MKPRTYGRGHHVTPILSYVYPYTSYVLLYFPTPTPPPLYVVLFLYYLECRRNTSFRGRCQARPSKFYYSKDARKRKEWENNNINRRRNDCHSNGYNDMYFVSCSPTRQSYYVGVLDHKIRAIGILYTVSATYIILSKYTVYIYRSSLCGLDGASRAFGADMCM